MCSDRQKYCGGVVGAGKGVGFEMKLKETTAFLLKILQEQKVSFESAVCS